MNSQNVRKSSETVELLSAILAKQAQMLGQLLRPHVIVDIYPRWFVNMLYFRVRNVGRTPAYNIRVNIDPPIPIRKRKSSDLNIFKQPIGVLGPNEEVSFFFDSAVELFNEEEPTLQFEVELKYLDSNGSSYDQAIAVNIDMLRDLAVELPAYDKMVEKLERIQNEIEKIARYVDHLRSQELRKAYRESQGQAEATAQVDNSPEG